MAPEYGATVGFFPVDDNTLAYLRASGRDAATWRWSKPIAGATCCSATPRRPSRCITRSSKSTSRMRSRRWPARGGRRTACRCRESPRISASASRAVAQGRRATAPTAPHSTRRRRRLPDGAVVIAAITSCTNTSNPAVMIAAGLLARNAARGSARTSVGEDVARARARRSSRLPARGGPARIRSRRSASTCRLRLHDVRRQIGSARSRGGRRAHRARRCGRGRGAFRQPQLRGPHPPAGARELHRLAAAGGRLCAGGAHRHRPTSEPLARDGARQARVSRGPVADARRDRTRTWRSRRIRELFPRRSTTMRKRAPPMARARARRASDVLRGTGSRRIWSSAVLRPASPASRLPERHRRRARARGVRRFAHHRPHLAERRDPGRRRPAATWIAGIAPRDFNTYVGAPLQPRGDGARHLREHAHSEPAGAGQRGRYHATIPSGEQMSIHAAASATASEACRWSCSPAGLRHGHSRDWAAKGRALLGVRAVIADRSSASTGRIWSAWGWFRCSSTEGEGWRQLGLRGASATHRELSGGILRGEPVKVTAQSDGTSVASP